jgi:hypothetical protein
MIILFIKNQVVGGNGYGYCAGIKVASGGGGFGFTGTLLVVAMPVEVILDCPCLNAATRVCPVKLVRSATDSRY